MPRSHGRARVYGGGTYHREIWSTMDLQRVPMLMAAWGRLPYIPEAPAALVPARKVDPMTPKHGQDRLCWVSQKREE